MPTGIGVRDVGLPAKDLAAVKACYQDVLELTVVRETAADASCGASVFLVHPGGEQDHDLAFFADPVGGTDRLRRTVARRVEDGLPGGEGTGVPLERAVTCGVQWSFYFRDPQGHRIEIYWLPPMRTLAHPQRLPVMGAPIDLDRSAEELRREVGRTAQRFGVPVPATAS